MSTQSDKTKCCEIGCFEWSQGEKIGCTLNYFCPCHVPTQPENSLIERLRDEGWYRHANVVEQELMVSFVAQEITQAEARGRETEKQEWAEFVARNKSRWQESYFNDGVKAGAEETMMRVREALSKITWITCGADYNKGFSDAIKRMQAELAHLDNPIKGEV